VQHLAVATAAATPAVHESHPSVMPSRGQPDPVIGTEVLRRADALEWQSAIHAEVLSCMQ
jgi:hypothetical protein